MNIILKRLALNYKNKYIWPDSFSDKDINKSTNESPVNVYIEDICSGEAWKKYILGLETLLPN